MGADIRQAIRRLGKQPLPRILHFHVRQVGMNLSEVLAQANTSAGYPFRCMFGRSMHDIVTAHEQPAVIGPAKVVIRAGGIPRHHRRLPQTWRHASGGNHEGVLHLESADEAAKLRGRIACRDDDGPRSDEAARSSNLDTALGGGDAACGRSLEDLGAVGVTPRR